LTAAKRYVDVCPTVDLDLVPSPRSIEARSTGSDQVDVHDHERRVEDSWRIIR
jgi:hypothetical protein